MTVLGLKMAHRRNGVSQLHASVCHRMWQGVWPELAESKVPISNVTNGIHVSTWLAHEMANLYQKYVDKDWLSQEDDPRILGKSKSDSGQGIDRNSATT